MHSLSLSIVVPNDRRHAAARRLLSVRCSRWLLPALVLRVGLLHADIIVGGARPVTVHVPLDLDIEVPAPLLIVLHGYTWSGAQHEAYWRVTPLANDRGVLYAYPDGRQDSGGNRFWSATDATQALIGDFPDVDAAYLRGLIDEIDAQFEIDRDRVFFAGLSNGAFMSYRMACDHADVVAAIASQAGATYADPERCSPVSPVHVLEIHGTSDDSALFDGGSINGVPYPGAVATVRQWAELNGCTLEEEMLDLRLDLDAAIVGAETTIRRFVEDCNSGGSAELWTIPGGLHVPNLTANGSSTNLAVEVVDWLLGHSKRPVPEATFTVTPERGVVPLQVAAEVSASAAPDGTAITRYRWSFDVGERADGAVASHTYASPGRRVISLVAVTDDVRVSSRFEREVTVLCPSGNVSPWTPAEVGDPVFPGAARPSGSEEAAGRGALRFCAGGRGIMGRSDELFFVHRELGGDFQITAQVSELVGATVQVGLMLRANLAADAAFRAMLLEVSPTGNHFRFRRREAPTAQAVSRSGGSFESAGWIRIERRGNLISGFSSIDGATWDLVSEADVDGMPDAILAGVAVASRQTQGLPVPAQVLVSSLETTELARFLRGDPNSDGATDISDGVVIFGHLFLGNPAALSCRESADTNNDGTIDISDGIYLLSWLFTGGPEPAVPGPTAGPCGFDPDPPGSPGDLGCAEYPPCR
jgi:polyhydroxybutyrate depolymerase